MANTGVKLNILVCDMEQPCQDFAKHVSHFKNQFSIDHNGRV